MVICYIFYIRVIEIGGMLVLVSFMSYNWLFYIWPLYLKEILWCGKLGAYLHDSSAVGYYTSSFRFLLLTVFTWI